MLEPIATAIAAAYLVLLLGANNSVTSVRIPMHGMKACHKAQKDLIAEQSRRRAKHIRSAICVGTEQGVADALDEIEQIKRDAKLRAFLGDFAEVLEELEELEEEFRKDKKGKTVK